MGVSLLYNLFARHKQSMLLGEGRIGSLLFNTPGEAQTVSVRHTVPLPVQCSAAQRIPTGNRSGCIATLDSNISSSPLLRFPIKRESCRQPPRAFIRGRMQISTVELLQV